MKNIHPNHSIIVDSGFWVALANVNDTHHLTAKQALNQLDQFVAIVTWPVIVETSHLLQNRVGFQAQQLFLKNIQQGGVDIFHLDQKYYFTQIIKLMEKYQDLPMDLADASLVILAEKLGHGRILSTDQRDFRTYRWKNHQPFENLLLTD